MNILTFHPLMVHFPIALLLVGFLFAMIAFVKERQHKIVPASPILYTAYWLLVLGSISALLAVLSGMFFTPEMTGIMGEIRANHASLAFFTSSLSVIAALAYTYYMNKKFESRAWQVISFSLYLITAALIGFTGHLGGQMVYGI